MQVRPPFATGFADQQPILAIPQARASPCPATVRCETRFHGPGTIRRAPGPPDTMCDSDVSASVNYVINPGNPHTERSLDLGSRSASCGSTSTIRQWLRFWPALCVVTPRAGLKGAVEGDRLDGIRTRSGRGLATSQTNSQPLFDWGWHHGLFQFPRHPRTSQAEPSASRRASG